MIFNLTSGGGNVGPIIPVFSGAYNFVTSPSGKSGYIEIFESGTLAWTGAVLPAKVDITCVGGGSGGLQSAYSVVGNETASWTIAGVGGNGGFVTTEKGVEIPEVVDVVIGAGGTAGVSGGTTSVGDVCSASGGIAPVFLTYYASYWGVTHLVGVDGKSGGNAGGMCYIAGGNSWDGLGGNFNNNAAGPGRSNGEQHTVTTGTNRAILAKSQGTPTVDILGRKHAGGGAAGQYYYVYNATGVGTSFAGGASDFESGSGTKGSDVRNVDMFAGYDITAKGGLGGGGYGGGGGGGGIAVVGTSGSTKVSSGSPGGNGFVIIGWGDYLSLYTAA